MYPLVRELAAADAPHRVPVAVTCRVLGLARQPYYRWLERPVTDTELSEAYRANALFDAHRDDPEFGHRFLPDEAHAAGEPMAGADRLEDLPRPRLVKCPQQTKRPQQERQGRAACPR
ncbi:hypothetical protein ACFW5L_28030 [Streptomyces albidoflavus]